MTGPANLDRLFLIGGWLIGGFAAALLLWALFRDRGKTKRRCPKCWYDMSGTPGLQCPECGRTAQSERRLHRTRRRWKLATLACLLGFFGYVVASVPQYQSGGWVALVPSGVLVVIAPATPSSIPGGPASVAVSWTGTAPVVLVTPTTNQSMTDEVWRRVRADRLARWQSQLFIGRYMRKYKINIFSQVTLPDRWPVGEPIPALFIRGGGFEEMPICARDREGSWVLAPGRPFPGRSTPGKSLSVELAMMGQKEPLYRATREFPVTIEGTPETLLKPRSSEVDNALVAKALSTQIEGNVVVLHNRSERAEWRAIDFGVAYTFEVTLDGAVLFEGRGTTQWQLPVGNDRQEFPIPEPARAAVRSGRAMITVKADAADLTAEYMSWPFDKPSAARWAGEYSARLDMKPLEK